MGTGEFRKGNTVVQFYRTRNPNKPVRRNLVSKEKSADWEWRRNWEGWKNKHQELHSIVGQLYPLL